MAITAVFHRYLHRHLSHCHEMRRHYAGDIQRVCGNDASFEYTDGCSVMAHVSNRLESRTRITVKQRIM